MNWTTLVSAEQLASVLGQPRLRLFDCRHDLTQAGWGAAAYRQGHLPGAHHLDLDQDLSGPKNGGNGRHPLPDAALLTERLLAEGLNADTQVVAYDDAGGMYAARLWWLLRWLGHPQVAVLDGGLAAWQRAALPLTVDKSATVQRGNFTAHPDSAPSIDAAQLLAELAQWCIVDARAAERFRGENETLDPVGGHIPGARNRPFRDNLDATGLFKPAAQLRSEWLALLGDAAAGQVVSQCGSGVTACHNLLALEVAGLPGARLYPGSWSEWCADPTRPLARG